MTPSPTPSHPRSQVGTVVVAWLVVVLPLLWGVWQTVKKAAALFR